MKLGATGVLAVVGVGVAAYLAWRAYQGAGTVAQAVSNTIKTDLNPTNSGNLANRAFEAVQAPVTGESSFSDWLLKTFQPSAYEALQNKPTPIRRATDTGDETARLLARYPAPVAADNRDPSILFGGGSFGELSGLGSTGFGGLWNSGDYFTGIPSP